MPRPRPPRSALPAAAIALVLCAAAPALAEVTITASPARATTFAAASGAVACAYTPPAGARPARVRCDLLRGARAGAAEMTPRGRARLYRPAAPLTVRGSRRAMRRGSVLVAGPLRCSWDGADMVCISTRSPYGFVVGRSGRAVI